LRDLIRMDKQLKEALQIADTKYLIFVEIDNRPRKTRVYNVHSQSSGVCLAVIKWFSQWRQYDFEPVGDTRWNIDCLNDIIYAINKLAEERKLLSGLNKG